MLNDVLTQLKLLWLPYQIKSLQNFVEKTLRILESPFPFEDNIYEHMYNKYVENCKLDNVKPVSDVVLSRIFTRYGMKNIRKKIYFKRDKKYKTREPAICKYGMQINKECLEELAKDCKEVVTSNGSTVVMQNGWPHYLRLTLVPVNNKIAEAILGVKVEGLTKENKTLEN